MWYRLTKIPDLTLNKYTSLEGNGVDGVIEKHIAFLRQLNRKGIVSNLSYHLFYLYVNPEDKSKDVPGNRLQIYFLIRGESDAMENVPALIKASPLADFFELESRLKYSSSEDWSCSIENVLKEKEINFPVFNTCSFLTKTETVLSSGNGEREDYYMLREWSMNEDGRLYNMCKMMESLNRTALYRVDLFPVEKSILLRESLRKPMNFLRKRQDDRVGSSRRDYDGKDVLDSYEDLIEKYDSSPHFIANILVFANGKEDAISILDAAGSESLIKGKYNIASFSSNFDPGSFLFEDFKPLNNMREQMLVRKGNPGLIVCRDDTFAKKLNYLPTLFSLEEIEPFFRFPSLYDGEIIQIPKETTPILVEKKGSLYLGKDKNGYDVFFPLKLLTKHAFVSGVPGSGKTNTMLHIMSSLWKRTNKIPFLVLEPAKQEYRALANDLEMNEMYLFSPNADMSFPLHINPFEMPKGILIAEHIRRLCSVFEGAFPLEAPMPFLLDTAIEAVYRELGWIPEHVYLGNERQDDGKKKRFLPTMSMLYSRLEQELKSTQYSDDIRGNLESALKVRIGSLLRREMGDVFDVPKSTFLPEKWLEVPAVIELESMGAGPANFLTLMLCSLIRETLKVNPQCDRDVRHVIFIEEAHNLIGPESEEQTGANANPKQAATAFIVKMLAEVRALKEGIFIADQLPTVMAQEVLKNTGLKIGHRITSADDRSLLGSTMAASSLQLEQMATFSSGDALVFYEKLMRPFTMRMKLCWNELEDKKKREKMIFAKNDKDLRFALKGKQTYHDQNLLSIKIVGSKYYYMFTNIEKSIQQCKYWLHSVLAQCLRMNKLYAHLGQVYLNKIDITDEKLRNEFVQFEKLKTIYESRSKDKKMQREPFRIIETVGNWIFTLERLKQGRWKRFGATKSELIKIIYLQSLMCNSMLELYGKVIQVVEIPNGIELVNYDIKKLDKLSREVNEDLNVYVKTYGTDIFYQD